MKHTIRPSFAALAIMGSFVANAQLGISGADTITGTKLERQLLGRDSIVWLQPTVQKPGKSIAIPGAACQPGAYQLSFFMGGQQLSATVLLENGALDIAMEKHGEAISPAFTGADGGLNTAYNTWKQQEYRFAEDHRRYAQLAAVYADTAGSTRRQLEAWWLRQRAAWDAYKISLVRQWQGHALATVVASTWGEYYAAYPPAGRSQLLAALPPLGDLRYNANLVEGKDEEYMRLLFATPAKDADGVTDTLLAYLPALLGKGQANDSLLRYWCHNISKQARQLGLDAVQELLDARYLAQSCTADADTALQQRLAAYKNTRKGSLAPKITTDGFDLYSSVQADSTLLVFWASWCAHCQEELPILYKSLLGRPRLQVVAVALDDSEPAWQAAKKQFPTWQHVRAPKKWDDANVLPYGIYATPTMFLLDRDKHITAKYNSITTFLQPRANATAAGGGAAD